MRLTIDDVIMKPDFCGVSTKVRFWRSLPIVLGHEPAADSAAAPHSAHHVHVPSSDSRHGQSWYERMRFAAGVDVQ